MINKLTPYNLKNKMTYILNTKLQTLNNRLDKLSMAHGVEFREPFLTKSLIEFNSKLPDNQLVNKNKTKYILKKLSERYLPKNLIYRKKVGFSLPFNNWMKTVHFKKHINILQNRSYENKSMINQKYIDRLIDKFNNDNDTFINSNSNKIWMLINIEKFSRKFIENRRDFL